MRTIEHNYDTEDRVDVIEQCNFSDEIVFFGWFDVPGQYTAVDFINKGNINHAVAIFKIKYK